jgi:hypothetical protein
MSLTLGAGLIGSGTAVAAPGKVTICHVPPGNARNAHTTEIASSALSAHLAHGDYLGACRPPVCSPGATTSCYSGPAGTAGVGACAEGTQTCNADGTAFGACVGEVQPGAEVCGDGLDNDCDGTSDEGCVCTPGSTGHCYDGPAGTAGVGMCAGGVLTCNADGTGFGPCIGQVTPAAETCGDGLDNDCDGTTDEGCVCAPGSTGHCYDGPAGTAGVGVCTGGTVTCNANGTGFGPCTGQVTPAAEVCGDGLDNDCDGVTDDGCVCTPGSTGHCYEGPTGTAGVGACQPGILTCNADGTGFGPCTGQVTPGAEQCGDAVDNDCDGVTDEGCVCTPGTTAACYSGPPSTEDIGTCASGTRACNSDGTAYGSCQGEILPASEVCGDGLDNDCDGVSDDGCVCVPMSVAPCYGGPPGTMGVGVCAAGVQLCNASGTSYGACIGDVVPSAETCGDGLDNDCDGLVDEGCIGDRAWRDLDGDGVQDAGEPGIAGVVFLLRNFTGSLVAVATSDLSGTYSFFGIPPGTYYIEVVPPVGFLVTAADAGSDDTRDSDFDGTSLASPLFTLVVNDSDIDCGFTQPATP